MFLNASEFSSEKSKLADIGMDIRLVKQRQRADAGLLVLQEHGLTVFYDHYIRVVVFMSKDVDNYRRIVYDRDVLGIHERLSRELRFV